jgi:TonB-dependent starch-binding outer membrane protein SusC
MKRGDVTGSIITVKTADLNKGAANVSVGQMLEGRVAGLYVNQHSGDPGADPVILVRGNGSLNVSTTTRPDGNNPNPLYNPLIGNSADPLVIVDGFPLAHSRDMNTISPNDIESISVLKDASSTAIYGARGANGVFIITTKTGKAGKVNVGYSSQFGSSIVANQLSVLNDKQYLNFYRELTTDPACTIDSKGNFNLSQLQIDAILANDGGTTDWQKKVATSSSTINQSHNLTLSGGSESFKYVITGNYLKQFAATAPGAYERYNAKMRLGYEQGKFAFDVSMAYTDEKNDNNKYSYYDALISDPSQNLNNADGSFTAKRFLNSAAIANPLFAPSVTTSFWTQNTTYLDASARYEIFPGFKLRVNLGTSMLGYQAFLNRRAGWKDGGSNYTDNTASATYRKSGSSLAEVLADYTKKINDKNTITTLVGVSKGSKFYSDIYGVGTQFANTEVGYYDLNGANKFEKPITSWFESRSESAFGRINYNYDDKYLATVNFRADGATQFGPGHKVGYFPSAALGWRINNESFLKDVSAIENLKLRVGYGTSGNDNIPSGLTNLSYQYASYSSYTSLGLKGNYVPNPSLKWEKITTLNLGLDLGLKDFQAQIDYYIKNSTDVLLTKTVPVETGFEQILVNQGKVQNKGVEVTLGYQLKNIFGSKLSYSPQFNFAYNECIIKDLAGDKIPTGDIWIGQARKGSTILRETGSQFNSFYLYHFDGIWQTGEKTQAAKYGAKPGDPKMRDVNNDGILDSKDKYHAGNADPSVILGLANRFVYKNFELNVFIQGVFGNKVYNQNRLVLENPSLGNLNNLSPVVLGRWTPTNPSNTVDSKLSTASDIFVQSDKYLEDASFVRLKEVVLTYNFRMAPKTVIKDLRLGLGVTNVLTLTSYKGLNPDVLVNDNQWNMNPYTRTVTLSINANF